MSLSLLPEVSSNGARKPNSCCNNNCTTKPPKTIHENERIILTLKNVQSGIDLVHLPELVVGEGLMQDILLRKQFLIFKNQNNEKE
jgi:hypothetical protein